MYGRRRYGGRRSYGRRRSPGASGAGPRHMDWRTITAYASANSLSWPTDKVPPVQDTLARLGAINGLISMFPDSNTLIFHDADSVSTRNALYQMTGPFQTASGRIRHNRSSVANWAYDSNALMLGLLANVASPQDALKMWTSIGNHILTALGYIEQRMQYDYVTALQTLRVQAMQVEINTTAGRLNLTTLGGSPGQTTFPNTGPFGLPNPFGAQRTPTTEPNQSFQPNSFQGDPLGNQRSLLDIGDVKDGASTTADLFNWI